MKVLFVTNIPSPYRIEFFNLLGKHYDLTVWFQAKGAKNRDWEIEGLGDNFKYKFLKGKVIGEDKYINLGVFKELNKEKFDVYILGCYSSFTEMLIIQWLKFKKIPFILNSDGGFPNTDENLLLKKLKSYFISSADLCLSSGENCTNYLTYYGAKNIKKYPFSSVQYNPCQLIPFDEIQKDLFLKRYEVQGKKIILSVGQFIYRKGFDILIKSFKRIDEKNDTALLIIGGGPEKEAYKKLIQEQKIRNILLIDFIQKDELTSFYKAADIFVFPTRYDIWGLVLNEALNFGLPIISTNMAGAALDLVDDGKNGFIIDSDNVEMLEKRLCLLLQSKILRKSFSEKSKKISKNFSMEMMVLENVNIINEFIDTNLKSKIYHLI